MSTLDIRNNSAMMKRAEQLKRWEESDTNRAPATPRTEHGRKIKFSSGCVFLAACLSGDKEEVIQLLKQGADINTSNVDGLTALHQACIDDNLEMVEFLVDNGADINRQDNEGWTPLHATASCGFVSIARYLVESGADVAAVNSDGDLALDLAIDIQHLPMIDYMEKVVQELNIDVEKARKAEEIAMLNDAKKWLRSDASEVDRPHPKTGATALHVASAKGYTKVLSLLLAGRGNVDKQDNDGWTPLHAAAHWGQKETAEMLVESMADMDVRNYAGQSCIDVADRKMVKFLEELRANKRNKRRPSSQIRISDTIENHVDRTSNKIVRLEMRPDPTKDVDNSKINTNSKLHTTSEQPNEEEAPWRRKPGRIQNDTPTKIQVPDKDNSKTLSVTESNDVILRRTQSFENDEKFYQKYNELRARIKANSCPILPATVICSTQAQSFTNNNNNISNNNNKKPAIDFVNNSNITNTSTSTTTTSTANNHNNSTSTSEKYNNTTENTISTNQNYSVQRSASLKDSSMLYRNVAASPTLDTITPTTSSSTTKNATQVAVVNPPMRRSFVPPVRDEESETQRKAHAKRVRETRRSTQGVTLDEIKSAEELVKKKNLGMTNNNNNNNNTANETQFITTTTSTSISTTTTQEPQPPPPPDSEPPLMKPQTKSFEEQNIIETSENEISASFTIFAPMTNKSNNNQILGDTEEKGYSLINNDSNTIITDNTGKHSNKTQNEKTDTHAAKSTNLKLIATPSLEINTLNEWSNNIESPSSSTTDLISSSSSQTTTVTSSSSNMSVPTLFSNSDTVISSDSLNDKSLKITAKLESPVRLREKRSALTNDTSDSKILSSLNIGDSKNTETTPASSHTDLSARDSLISCYANFNLNSRRSLDANNSDTSNTSSEQKNSQKGVGGNGGNASSSVSERRPSWRLKFDAGSKFKLEDVTSGVSFPPNNSTIIPSAPAVIVAASLSSSTPGQRRISNASNQSVNSIGRPVSAPINANTNNGSDTRKYDTSLTSSTTSNTEASSLTSSNSANTTQRKYVATTISAQCTDDKDNDKENDNRTTLAAQGVIQRRRKPKRRSTGVVHIDMDELDPERNELSSANDTEDKEMSGSERTTRSRLGSTASNATNASNDTPSTDKNDKNDEIDYKALWEAAKLENDKLKQLLKQKDDEVMQTHAALERFTNATTKNSLSEIEKRERRAMERKLSELEEELKQLEVFKTDNHRLKEENAALIRVISKLSK